MRVRNSTKRICDLLDWINWWFAQRSADSLCKGWGHCADHADAAKPPDLDFCCHCDRDKSKPAGRGDLSPLADPHGIRYTRHQEG